MQYFGTVEPRKHGAPHFHAAIRGTIPRSGLRAITAATYRQVWWPAHDTIRYTNGSVPRWDDYHKAFVDPDTRDLLHEINQRQRWRAEYDAALMTATGPPDHPTTVHQPMITRPDRRTDMDEIPLIAPSWTVKGVAEYLRVPVQTLYAWRHTGYGPRSRRVGKHLRYRPSDVTQDRGERAGRLERGCPKDQ